MKKIQLLFIALLLAGSIATAQKCSNPTMPNKCCTIGTGNVTVGSTVNFTISNYNTAIKFYNEYNTQSLCVTAGSSHFLSVTTQNGNYQQAVCVWVDWDGNDSFSSSEIIMSNPTVGAGASLTDSLRVDTAQASGSYRMRVMVDYYYYYSQGQAYNACQPTQGGWGDYVDLKINVVGAGGTDMGITNVLQPYVLAIANNNPVEFTYTNLAGNTIDSFEAGYAVNGGNANTEWVTKTRSGATLSLATCQTDTFLFSQNINITQAGNYELKVWTSYPNNTQPDDNQNNDTATITACTALSGSYTIDKSQSTAGSNYASFGEAVAALNQCGVAGPVVFTVAPGTYKDSVVINPVNGASATNTITFDGVDTTNRIVQTFSQNSIVFSLNEASYIRFKHLTFKAGQYGTDVELSGACTDIVIDSCNFRVTNTAAQAYYGVYFNSNKGGGTPASYVSVTNCVIKEMYYGVYMFGNNATHGTNNTVWRNRISSGTYGILAYYQDSLNLSENIFRTTTGYPIYFFNVNHSKATRNDVDAPANYSMYLYLTTDTRIENNFFSGQTNTTAGVNFYNCSTIEFYHNTCFVSNASARGMATTGSSGLDVRNNIFYITGNTAYCLYANNSGEFSYLDFNVYHNANNSSNYVFIGQEFKTLAALTGQFGFNLNASNAKPNFVNATSTPRNLHLSSATMPSYGDYTTNVSIDVDGDSRCTIAPTIGADESKYAIAMPVSDFAAPDTAYINSPVLFTNKGSYIQGKFFEWYMDGASQVTYTSQDAWHTYTSLGTHYNTLSTTNCTGTHDTTKAIVIVNPPTAPKVYFKADKTDIEIMDEVQFTDSSAVGPVSWNWSINGGWGFGVGIDFDYSVGDSTSQHPKVVFYNAGYYTVCLTATNSVGATTVCKSLYIKVNSLFNMCQGTTVSDMFGRFYDDGGKNGNTINSNNQIKNCYDLIAPCSGPVTMTFTMVNFDTTNAGLYLYDGLNTSGKLLNKSAVKAGRSYTANSGYMFLHWTQPAYTQYPGWEANWTTQVKQQTKAPADIKVVDTGYAYGTEHYEVKYYQDGVQYDWDYENDGIIDYQGREGDYTYGAAGVYTCVCYATSCGGVDTAMKDVVVVNPQSAPDPVQFVVDVTSGSACKLKPRTLWSVPQGASIMFFDKSGKGPTSWEWDVPGANVSSYTWDNGNSIQNPSITFYDTGYYSISLKVSNAAGSSIDTFYRIIRVSAPTCTPTVSGSNQSYGITNFKFKDIDNTSQFNTQYMSYAGYPIACVENGKWYSFSMKRGSSANNARTAIWIDYNQDGDFYDAGEMVRSNANLGAQTWKDSLKINKLSSNVLWGHTIMRVGILDPSSTFKVCGNNTVAGEFEDYSIYIIDDQTPPVITLVGKDTEQTEQGLTFADPGALAYDANDGYILYTTTTNLNTANLGYYWVKYDAQDKAGNYALPVYRTVQVISDKSAPVITLLGANPYYQNVNTAFTDPWALAYDSVDGNINNITSSGSVNAAALGSYTIWYYAADSKGNKDSVMRTVIVQDIAPPSLTLNGTDTVHMAVYASYTEAGWVVNDNYDQNPTVTVTPAMVDSSVVQTVTLTYTAKDSTGNTTIKTRVVIVEDLIAPVITLNGPSPLHHEVKTAYTEPGATVSDNYSTGLSATISGGPVNPNVLGTYTITYSAVDGAGNTASVNRDVIVEKTTKPTIYLNGQDTVYLTVGQTYNDLGVNSIADVYYSSPMLMSLLQSNSTFGNPATTPGTYHTWYYVTDPSGNSDTATRTFIVSANGVRAAEQLPVVALWPNPANDVLFVGNLQNGLNQLEVFDAAGRQVLTRLVKGETGSVATTQLANGVYVLKCVNNGRLAMARFEITR